MIFLFGTLKNDHMLTLSCIAQVICDLAFLLATAQKSLKQKNYEKNLFPGKVFSLYFLLQDIPYNDAFLTYSAKSTKNPKTQVICWKNRTCHVMAPQS